MSVVMAQAELAAPAAGGLLESQMSAPLLHPSPVTVFVQVLRLSASRCRWSGRLPRGDRPATAGLQSPPGGP